MQWGEKYTRMRSYTARKFIARKFFYEIAKILLQIEGGISNIKINIEYIHRISTIFGIIELESTPVCTSGRFDVKTKRGRGEARRLIK